MRPCALASAVRVLALLPLLLLGPSAAHAGLVRQLAAADTTGRRRRPGVRPGSSKVLVVLHLQRPRKLGVQVQLGLRAFQSDAF